MAEKTVKCRIRNLTNNRRAIPLLGRSRWVYVNPGETSKEKEFLEVTIRKHQRLGLIEVIGADRVGDAKAKEVQKAASSLADLQAEARKLGVTVDGRWGESRLKREIAAKKSDS